MTAALPLLGNDCLRGFLHSGYRGDSGASKGCWAEDPELSAMGLWHGFAPVPLAMLTISLQSGISLGWPCTLVMAAGQPSLLAS